MLSYTGLFWGQSELSFEVLVVVYTHREPEVLVGIRHILGILSSRVIIAMISLEVLLWWFLGYLDDQRYFQVFAWYFDK